MPTVREEMEQHRREMNRGEVRRRGPVLVEALGTGAPLLAERVEAETPRPWTTQRIEAKDLAESQSQRIERMMALQELVGDESQIFALVKSEHNDSPNICIGRARRNDIVIDDDTVSSQHAVVEEGQGRLLLGDSSSSNGTWINQQAIGPAQQAVLRSGDCLRFGGCPFYYLSGGQFALFLKLRLQSEGG